MPRPRFPHMALPRPRPRELSALEDPVGQLGAQECERDCKAQHGRRRSILFLSSEVIFSNLKLLCSCKKIKVVRRALLNEHRQIYIVKSGLSGDFPADQARSGVLGMLTPISFLHSSESVILLFTRIQTTLAFVIWVSSEKLWGRGSHRLAPRHGL